MLFFFSFRPNLCHTLQQLQHSDKKHQSIIDKVGPIRPNILNCFAKHFANNQSRASFKLSQRLGLHLPASKFQCELNRVFSEFNLIECYLQSGVWDGLPQDILDIPFSNSPTAFLISPVKDKTSPAISPGELLSANNNTINKSIVMSIVYGYRNICAEGKRQFSAYAF